MKSLIDRPHNSNISNFDRLIVELSKYMNEFEIDQCVSFLETIEHSKYDINPSVEDSVSQLKLIIGSDRYNEYKRKWSLDNQHLTKKFGNKKYMRISDNSLWDGLDPEDNPKDYKEIFI